MPTDQQLKLALAGMVPKQISIISHGDEHFPAWKSEIDNGFKNGFVLDTEFLHLCWLVEETLTEDERDTFMRQIYVDLDVEGTDTGDTYPDYKLLHATWQQRTLALCKVKGIEVV